MPGATVAAWGGATLTVTVDDVDVSCDVVRLVVDRSKNRLWDQPDAGTCLIALNLEAGGVAASTGPIGSAVVVHVAYGATARNLFTGTVQMRRLEGVVDGDTIVLECVDGFERIGRVNRRADDGDTPVGGGDTPAQRIARWLDEADWDVALTDLDTTSAYTCPATLIDGNVLLQIQAAAVADGGEFFINEDGVATFLAWAWRTGTGPVAAVYSDRRLYDWVPYSSAELRDDLDEVQNQVSGVRRKLDDTDVPTVVTASNTASVTAYGPRGDSLDNLELEDDSQVSDRVTALVAIAAMPNPRFDAIVVQPAFDPARMWPRVIPCKFGSLVAANRLWPDSTEQAFYGHVLGEIWTFTATDASVTWRVSGTGSWDAHAPPRAPDVTRDPTSGCIKWTSGLPCDDTSDVIFEDADGDQVGDTFPPGSLCGDGICPPDIPDGATKVCLVNEFGTTCVDLPAPSHVLYLDVLHPGPNLVERVEGTALDARAGFLDTDVGGIPGGFDAIEANVDGGQIVSDHSGKLEAADLASGWSIEFWLYLTATLPPSTIYNLIILDAAIVVRIATGPTSTPVHLSVVVTDTSLVDHFSTSLTTIAVGAWHHYRIAWDSVYLHTFVDGTEV